MSIQDEFKAAGEEYARRLDRQAEADRLDALRLEARKHSNASAFAAALQDAFDQHDAERGDDE